MTQTDPYDPYAQTATATGGVTQVDANVVRDTGGLAVLPSYQGDGLTSINSIAGAGVLGLLWAPRADLAGGIDMAGGVKYTFLHDVSSNILMDYNTTGVTLFAHNIQNSTLSMDNIGLLVAA